MPIVTVDAKSFIYFNAHSSEGKLLIKLGNAIAEAQNQNVFANISPMPTYQILTYSLAESRASIDIPLDGRYIEGCLDDEAQFEILADKTNRQLASAITVK